MEGRLVGQNISGKLTAKENVIRFDIMNFIIDNKKAYNIFGEDYLNLKNSYNKDELNEEIKIISKKDGFVLDEEGNICFAYPVSANETHHKVFLEDGRSFSAMCAIDAMGSAFTFGQNTKIESMCSYCGSPVQLEVIDGKLVNCNKEDLHALSFKLDQLDNWAASC